MRSPATAASTTSTAPSLSTPRSTCGGGAGGGSASPFHLVAPPPSPSQDPPRARTRSARLGFFTPEAFAITDEASLELLSFDENEGLPPQSSAARLLRWLKSQVRAVSDNTIVFFAKNADFVTLNRVRDGVLAAARL